MQIRKIALAAAALTTASGIALAQPLGESWLLGAPDDAARFEILERDAGGTGRTMLEMSIRYERMYQAIVDGNLQFALQNWDGIVGSLDRGLVRRPDRTDLANAFILDTLADEVAVVLESGDVAASQEAFLRVRSACMGCHQASELGYMNDQPLFSDLVLE